MKDKKKTLEKEYNNSKLKKITNKKKLKEKGITLIALVVTIIILLILAGVTLNIALSDNGLFNKAKKAADDYNQKSIEEELQILFAEKQMENYKNKSKGKADVTELLEEKLGEGKITQEEIEKFNEYLEDSEKIRTISNAEDFKKIGKESETEYPIDGIYVQMDNISLGEFTPIGTEDAPFTGVFNGNGKKISSLTITATSDNAGMFGASEGTIKNVTIENCNITSSKGVFGAIVGKNLGLIENCEISAGQIIGTGYYSEDENAKEKGVIIGSICGSNGNGGMIKNCKNFASVTGSYKLVGGICGYNYGGDIDGCTNIGVVTGPCQVGGIAGDSQGIDENNITSLVNCINKGEIKGQENEMCPGLECGMVGGIVGCNFNYSLIKNCVNEENVSSNTIMTGGIAGYDRYDIRDCENKGSVRVNRDFSRYNKRIYRRYCWICGFCKR